MKIRFNKTHLMPGGMYFNLALSLIQEGVDKRNVNDGSEFTVPSTRFSIQEVLGFVDNNVIVEGCPVWIYADISILGEEVYPELISTFHEEGNSPLFSDWNDGGTQPLHTSIDGTKVILRTNIGGRDLNGSTIKGLSNRGVELLDAKTLKQKINSDEFSQTPFVEEKNLTWIDNNWISEFTDFKQARSFMKEAVEDIGFENLSHKEKVIAARWHVIGISDINNVLSFQERMIASEFFNTMSIRSRDKRLGACLLFGRNVLDYNDGNDILNDILEFGFINSYVTLGREGTMEFNPEGHSDPDGIIDYILAREGTRFEHNGLLTKDIVPINGMTLKEFADKLVDILLNGNY